ncbi:MAG: long-chain N-acyl amino acid synthase [Pseudomonadota bacterium]|nr:long-chain N-acyl amino acid synthase [Pseudomonadota bacterium]
MLAWIPAVRGKIPLRRFIFQTVHLVGFVNRPIAHLTLFEGSMVLSNTMTAVPFEAHHSLRSMLQAAPEPDEVHRCEISQRLYNMRSADSFGQRSSASILIKRMYATRGYPSMPLPEEPPPTRITLVASEEEATVATITIGFDSPEGLHVDALFAEQANALRDAGQAICEFTTLAMDNVVSSRRVLASLFHLAYIYAHRVMGFDSLLIEVNPRHVTYYRRMLGFQVIGPQRFNLRVNAPAVLLCLDFAHAREQIARFGGRPECARTERSLYPDSFSASEEAGIVGRLKPIDPELAIAARRYRPPCLLQA